MKDGSRILVVRPPFSESWAFFVRKFYIKNVTLEMLIKDKNAELPINLIKYIIKGSMITSVTGQQGSGKTTMLMAMVKHIYPTLTLRIQEMAFELNLRKLYPDRNILSFRETETIWANGSGCSKENRRKRQYPRRGCNRSYCILDDSNGSDSLFIYIVHPSCQDTKGFDIFSSKLLY